MDWQMDKNNLNVSSMNYGDVEAVAQTVQANGQIIFDSVNNIQSIFGQVSDAGFAGSTLEAVLAAMDKIKNVPQEILDYSQAFSKVALDAVEEVRAAENQVLSTLTEIISMDPTQYEMPEWATAE